MLGGQAARQGVEGPEGGLEGGLQGGLEGKHWVESLKGNVDPLVPRGDLNDRWSVVLALRPKMMITIVNTAPPSSPPCGQILSRHLEQTAPPPSTIAYTVLHSKMYNYIADLLNTIYRTYKLEHCGTKCSTTVISTNHHSTAMMYVH